ncbi:hypothetical protein [Mesobacillus subterraneus]|uniref:ABM domain-containing protein n=1 Tax=Mesobacillus subterraneus TaxID=285983 RepID=A0A427TM64_9BACI|nr:hypothetical protein [Mesobacillus subterraneus]RSD25446.1 hypothetical protein EJA10_16705 [Mesobacillus subterraneus]
MSVIVFQTFELKQDKFPDGIKNLRLIQNFRNEHYDHIVELLSPITGEDHTYALISTYEGLAEMELQNKKMFEDEEYKQLIGEFFLENIVQGSMYTQMYRTMTGLKSDSESEDKKK